MARYTGPKTKISRALGYFIEGNPKAFKHKNYPPGVHGRKRRKRSPYALQLAAKRKVRELYGMLETPFHNLFKKAAASKGVTGDSFLQMLESRLDNIIYRLGIAPTRRSARQLVSHRHVKVNGKVVNIASYSVRPQDTITISQKAEEMPIIQEALANYRNPYEWILWDAKSKQGTLLSLPQRAQIPEKIDEKSIIELYSR